MLKMKITDWDKFYFNDIPQIKKLKFREEIEYSY